MGTHHTGIPPLQNIQTPIYVSGYGALYNVYAIRDVREISPVGFHIPSESEWNTLLSYVGYLNGFDLTEKGVVHWNAPNNAATDLYGFSSVGSGARMPTGFFINMNIDCILWSSTVYNASYNLITALCNINNCLSGCGLNTGYSGSAIRYLKDDSTLVDTVTGNDGTIYDCIKIGSQVWTKQNSKETKFRNGDDIDVITDYDEWGLAITSSMCYYHNYSPYA